MDRLAMLIEMPDRIGEGRLGVRKRPSRACSGKAASSRDKAFADGAGTDRLTKGQRRRIMRGGKFALWLHQKVNTAEVKKSAILWLIYAKPH
jgi:hypothetical protein